MPNKVQHIRDGEALSYHWGAWHRENFIRAMEYEQAAPVLTNVFSYEFTAYHQFKDRTDGEIMTIVAGDRVESWYDW